MTIQIQKVKSQLQCRGFRIFGCVVIYFIYLRKDFVTFLEMKMHHEYATWVLDLIAITVITFEFFIYSSPDAFPDALEMVKVSDLLFITVLPSIAIISHLLFRRSKLEPK